MRGLFNSAHNTIANIGQDMRETFRSHFGNHIGGSLSGFYVRIPFTRFSAFIEWREVGLGFGHQRGESSLEVFAGRVQGVFCVEPKASW